MIWSYPALYAYLYGKRYELRRNAEGLLEQVRVDLKNHTHNGKTIPSAFFEQPETEHISAILTSASGTLSKFNRMGRQAGYGDPDIRVVRIGSCYDHDPNAFEPKGFRYEVNEKSEETWSEGINVYHNPHARMPLEPEMFPFAGHHTVKDGDIVSMLPDFHPFASWTINLTPKGKEDYPDGLITPRYCQ
jgi:hypothetical protein